MRINWTPDEPMNDHEMRAVVWLVHKGKLADGAELDRPRLAELLGCKHTGAPCIVCMEQLN